MTCRQDSLSALEVDAGNKPAALKAEKIWLALVIVFDQYSRNVFRGTARAFAGDVQAQQLTLNTLAQQEDQELPWIGRVFLYMPLMHAEDLALQEKCVSRFFATGGRRAERPEAQASGQP